MFFILDLEINEELRDEVYYKLLPSILKISETIQSSRDYREKSYVVRDKNEKEKYRIMANKKVIYQISLRNLRNKTLKFYLTIFKFIKFLILGLRF